jgi:hypothetical protein
MEVKNCLFSVGSVVKYLTHFKEKADQDLPSQGFIAVGSMDENWGWLRLVLGR